MPASYRTYANDELVRLLQQDDAEAFTEIYQRYWQKMFAIAINRLHDSALAEDVVHDVFASLWANRTEAAIQTIENYLAVATKYMVLTRLKQQARQQQLLQQAPTTVAVNDEVELRMQQRQILARIAEEVEKLPEKCRLIFKYSREAGMPVKEIARVLQLSPKTVENQLTKALRQLRVATRSFFMALFLFLFL